MAFKREMLLEEMYIHMISLDCNAVLFWLSLSRKIKGYVHQKKSVQSQSAHPQADGKFLERHNKTKVQHSPKQLM